MLGAEIKIAARGRWRELLVCFGVDADFLRNTHGPCPGCGGKDRFRFDDHDGDGTFICSQGGGELLSGDGFTLLEHVKKWDFSKCISEVRRELHVPYVTSSEAAAPRLAAKAAAPKAKFAGDKLAQFAARWRPHVNTAWLADRSAIDPVGVSSCDFLSALYGGISEFEKLLNSSKNSVAHSAPISEKVLIFTNPKSQGQALWPDDKIPDRGPEGVWFLAQPVDGKFYENPRAQKQSRRSEESVLSWRYLVLESDRTRAIDWLAALVQLPLCISAVYTSGGHSIHALVRVAAPSLHEWRNFARELVPILVRLGADQQVASSAVRLTRLPGCLRGDQLQKLLYLNPDPQPKAITGLPVLRDSLSKIRLVAESYLSTSCAEIIERFGASNLTECIKALDRHKNIVSKSRDPVIRALEWFESSPIAADLLARLRSAKVK